MRMMPRSSIVIAILIAVLALVLRLPGLGDFMTVDEENWMLRSAGFWHKMFRDKDTGGTFMTTHPGATVMWLAGAGIAWQEARLGFDIDTSNLNDFRFAATLPIAVATALLIGLSAYMLARLGGRQSAIAGGVVLAADPYLAGMSQIVHLDSLLALLMLNSVLAFFLYVRFGHVRWLIFTGILAGLALATKLLPALWLFMFLGVVLFVGQMRKVRTKSGIFGPWFFVFGLAVFVFWMVWPALWFKDDVLRSFNRDVPLVVTQAHVAIESSDDPVHPASFYGRTLAGRTTPFVLVLSIGMLILFGLRLGPVGWSWHYRRLETGNHPPSPSAVAKAMTDKRLRRTRKLEIRNWEMAWLLFYALGYLLVITFVAKKADRYALPALVVLPFVAGWGFELGWQVIRNRWPGRWLHVAAILVVAMVVALPLLWSPYAIAYNNPWFPDIRPLSQQGWGEGLDGAARWLNEHPLADRLMVASWYPGVTGTYFGGATGSLSSRDDDRVGFVITYRNMAGREPDDIASNVWDEFKDRKPAHVVSILGTPYAWIYDTISLPYFPLHVGELVQGMEVGQTVTPAENGWNSIEIGLATFSSRANSHDVILHVRSGIDKEEDLRTVVVNAAEIADSAYHRFQFEPILDSADVTYYVALTSPLSVPGNAITVRFIEEDILPGDMVLRRRPLQAGEQNGDFVRQGDIAYRLP